MLKQVARSRRLLSWRAGAAPAFLKSGALLFVSITIVNAGNYLFNLLLGRWLDPAQFAEISLIITLMLVITFLVSTLQTVAARFAAIYTANEQTERLSQLYRLLNGWSWKMGSVGLVIFVAGAPLWQMFFNTTSVWPFVLLGLGLPFYFNQGVDRGILQGQTVFGRLIVSYQAEMWVRLIIGLGLVGLGWSVNGAVGAVALSFLATWLVLQGSRYQKVKVAQFEQSERSRLLDYSKPVALGLVGQALISNSDVLLVKHFFEGTAAGHYAALALVGRIVFFATWSVVTAFFGMVAQKQAKGESHRYLLVFALGAVGLISVGITGATLIAPDFIVWALFGNNYLEISGLLWLYALTTSLYALANAAIQYRLALGHGGGSWLALGAGIAQVGGIILFHQSLLEVVLVQLWLMAGLLIATLVWDAWLYRREKKA